MTLRLYLLSSVVNIRSVQISNFNYRLDILHLGELSFQPNVPVNNANEPLCAALTQMVACLPLVQRVWDSFPGEVINFHLKIFNLGARRGGNCTLSNRQIVHHRSGLNSSRPIYICMLRRHIVLLIAIRLSDGDVKPGGHLGAFRKEQAMIRHRVSPSPFHHHPTQHNYTTHTVTETSPIHYTDTCRTCNVVCPNSG